MARRRLHRALIALAAAAVPVAGVVAQPSPAQRCDRASKTSADIVDCLQKLQVAADQKLNRTYAKAMAGLPPADRLALRDAQRAWLRFRALDRTSLFGSWRGDRGTLSRIETAEADVEAIEARERELRVYLTDPALRGGP